MPADSGFTVRDLLHNFSAGTIERGTKYARENRISAVQWSVDNRRVSGMCRGSGDQSYRTVVDFVIHSSPPTVVGTRCSCPVAFDCKHAVALVITEGARLLRTDDSAIWRQFIAEIESDDVDVIPTATTLPLGLMFSTESAGDSDVVTVRPVTLGARGRWIKSKATWRSLSMSNRATDYHPRQLSAVRDLLRSVTGTSAAYFARDALTLVSAPPAFWRSLSDAVDAGVVLAAEGLQSSTVALANAIYVAITVVPDADGLRLAPTFRCDSHDVDGHAVMVGGARATGALLADGSTVWIGPFESPLTPTETALFGGGRDVRVPAADVGEFTAALPALSRRRVVTVPDDVLRAPVVSGPMPLLIVAADTYGARLTWHVRYEIDGSPTTFDALAPTRESRIRDADAERTTWEAARDAVCAVASVCPTWRHQAIDFVHSNPGMMRATELFAMLNAVSSAPNDIEAQRVAPIRMLNAPLRLYGAEVAVLRNEIVPKLGVEGTLNVEWTGVDVDFRLPQSPPEIRFGADGDAPKRDWFDLAINLMVDDKAVPISRVISELSVGATHMVLDDGTYFALDAPELTRLGELLTEAREMGELDGDRVNAGTVNVTLWEELLELGVVDNQVSEWHRRLSRLSTARPPASIEPPAGLHAQLRHYQRDGLDWLCFLWDNQLGGILADDMGLGKTLQTLALISRAVESDPSARFLVVAPTSVITNWAAEVRRFTPDLRVCEVVSTQARAGESIAGQIGDAHIVVTSYTLLRIDVDAFAAVEFAGAIFDEAQFIKNRNGKTYQAARRLEAPFKLAITGTPMENNLMELWSLLSVGAPGLFASPSNFREYFAKPIESGAAPEQLATLRKRIKPLMLRRTKSEVVTDLPPKQEQVISVSLGTKHRKRYDTTLARERQKVLGLLDDFDNNRFMILRSLTRLRQLSLHAGLVDPDDREVASAKVDYLTEQVPELVAEGHNALVFSTFTGFLELLAGAFDSAGIGYAYLDGSMTARQRAATIDRFTSGEVPVFLISLKAGGFGLNLTQADYCFVCDPWWNPAAEAQAVDRAHRIGQQRPVNVYRLVSAGTIEEKVVELQERKRELFTAVVDDGNAFSGGITASDIRGLLAPST